MTGVLPVDKPADPTSHDVVAMARRALGVRRIGHTGTLDPFATGLLLLCVGPATRLAEYLSGLDKTYEAVARIGAATDTHDPTGTVVSTDEGWSELDAASIRRAFEEQQGRRRQAPPAYSAKKIGGRRAYAMARDGVDVALDPVDVTIHELVVTRIDGADVAFRMRCSSGTYVRAVARDAGAALGVGAHLRSLRRTAVGRFSADDAVPVAGLADEDAVRDALLTPLDALAHLARVDLDAGEAARVRHGQALENGGRADAGVVALAEGATLVAVAEADDRSLRPRKVFS